MNGEADGTAWVNASYTTVRRVRARSKCDDSVGSSGPTAITR